MIFGVSDMVGTALRMANGIAIPHCRGFGLARKAQVDVREALWICQTAGLGTSDNHDD
jgi:hypothetical protein